MFIRQIRGLVYVIIVSAVMFTAATATAVPWATEVISFSQGTNGNTNYIDSATALGEPSRVTGVGSGWDGDVTMFNGAWDTDQIVSIGAGGSLVVKFDHQVIDNPSGVNWGIDFLIFGNAYFNDSNYPNGIANGIYNEPGKIEVSQDNVTWYAIAGVTADDLFPSQGYTNSSGPYAYNGTANSDFTKPVNPNISWDGKSYGEILGLYAGSGGGSGVNISGTGLDWIQYVKVYQDSGDSWSTEIDGFADVVPEPTTVVLLCFGGSLVLGKFLLRHKRV